MYFVIVLDNKLADQNKTNQTCVPEGGNWVLLCDFIQVTLSLCVLISSSGKWGASCLLHTPPPRPFFQPLTKVVPSWIWKYPFSNFPEGPVVEMLRFQCRSIEMPGIWFLVGELRSYVPRGKAKLKNKKI